MMILGAIMMFIGLTLTIFAGQGMWLAIIGFILTASWGMLEDSCEKERKAKAQRKAQKRLAAKA